MATALRGRPARKDWLTPAVLARLPAGTAVALDLGKQAGIRGRIAGSARGELGLADGRVVALARVERGRVVNGMYEPGDLVLKRGVGADAWRGGVIRCEGTEVYVESTDGYEWVHEDLLESAERDASLNARAHVSPDRRGTAA